MITAWRAVRSNRVATAFDGEGARLHGGRWNSPGVRAVYLSESRALATLEILAGLGGVTTLPEYALIPVTFDPALVHTLTLDDMPSGWNARPPGRASQGRGDAWIAEGTSAVLRVPSVLIPAEHNYVMNPAHPGMERIRIGQAEVTSLDPRLQRGEVRGAC